MTGTDHRIHNRAVHEDSIAGSGKSEDQDDDNAAAAVVVAVAAAAAEDGDMWYDQAVDGDGEIGAVAARTEAPAEIVSLERQTSTQIPGADSPFGKGSVFWLRLAEKAAGRAMGRENILVLVVGLDAPDAGLAVPVTRPQAWLPIREFARLPKAPKRRFRCSTSLVVHYEAAY